MKKPIVGIVAKYTRKFEGRREALISDEVKNAIIDNGGIAIGILPSETEISFIPKGSDACEDVLTTEQKQDLIRQISLCDGIILQGGKASLKYESWIAKYTFENDIPTLGICAGQNVMVRAVGGTTKSVSNPEKHNQYWAEEVHGITIKKGTKFHDMVGCDQMRVNSRHNKVIDEPTDKYIVSAICEDGYFEVLEAPNKKFNIAVRFHPESLYKTHREHNKIFEAFIEACRN